MVCSARLPPRLPADDCMATGQGANINFDSHCQQPCDVRAPSPAPHPHPSPLTSPLHELKTAWKRSEYITEKEERRKRKKKILYREKKIAMPISEIWLSHWFCKKFHEITDIYIYVLVIHISDYLTFCSSSLQSLPL